MARNTQSVARDFAVYAVETIRRAYRDDPHAFFNARGLYRQPSATADEIIRTVFENTTVEIGGDGEIQFHLPRVKRKDR